MFTSSLVIGHISRLEMKGKLGLTHVIPAPTPDAAAPPREELENCRKELLESEKQVLSRSLLKVKTVTGLRTELYSVKYCPGL